MSDHHQQPTFLVDDVEADVPSGLKLLEGDQVLSVERVPFSVPAHRSTAADLVAALCNVESIGEVGTKGMPLASKAFDATLGEGLYEAEFARDALVMTDFGDKFFPLLTSATVCRLAALQGVKNVRRNGEADLEEIGRIPHEMRNSDDPLAPVLTTQFGWDWPYFGTIDATPMFVSAVCRAAATDSSIMGREIQQRDEVTRTMAEIFERSVAWLATRVESDPNHLLSTRAATNGTWQVWADSTDAYFHNNGALASESVAAIEVQAIAYDALIEAAQLLDEPRQAELANKLRKSAIELMWQGSYFAYAYQRGGTNEGPLTALTANTAMVLRSAFLDGNEYRSYVEAIAAHVSSDASPLVCPSGIRTLSGDETRFRPYGYHTGSVWPWQNYWIADGLRRHGFGEAAVAIETKMNAIIESQKCFPEYVQGSDQGFALPIEARIMLRSQNGSGGTYLHEGMQPPQKFQGWTVFGAYAASHR